MIYLCVLDYSLTSKRLTTRTEQLTKCCKPLQKLRVSLGPCKNTKKASIGKRRNQKEIHTSKTEMGTKLKLN